MLPAVLYIPLLVASYFIFDLFHTETAEIPDKTLQTTEFLNPDLPDARLKGGDPTLNIVCISPISCLFSRFFSFLFSTFVPKFPAKVEKVQI